MKLPSPVAVEDHVSNGGGRAGAVEDAQGAVEVAQGVEGEGVEGEGVEGEDPEGSMRGWWDVSYLDDLRWAMGCCRFLVRNWGFVTLKKSQWNNPFTN